MTIRLGLEIYSGEILAIMMADGSDSPKDLIKFYYQSLENKSCVFGSRFSKGGTTQDYPKIKICFKPIFQ